MTNIQWMYAKAEELRNAAGGDQERLRALAYSPALAAVAAERDPAFVGRTLLSSIRFELFGPEELAGRREE